MYRSSRVQFTVNKRDAQDGKGQGNVGGKLRLPAWLLASCLILLVSAGCASFMPSQASGQDLPSGSVLFSDDFSKTPGGWGIWTRDGARVNYHNGGLRIQVDENQFDFWSVSGRHFGDVQVEVDAVKIGGPDDNDFGLICRYRSKENFYMLVVSSDGYYGIAKMKDGQYSMIGSDQLQYTSVVSGGEAINHLRADCVGSKLSLYANGQKLMETRDEDFSSGDVGVLAGAYDAKGVDILFDNFMVKKP